MSVGRSMSVGKEQDLARTWVEVERVTQKNGFSAGDMAHGDEAHGD
jgi:hypothetical protein